MQKPPYFKVEMLKVLSSQFSRTYRYLKVVLLIVVNILSANLLKSQPPVGYYDGTENLTGIALQAKLHDIIDDHTSVSYGSILLHFQTTDKKPNNTVWDMYSDIPGENPPYIYYFNKDECGNYNSEGDCFNREHSWPASWFNEQIPMYTDLFHIYPTDGYVNGKRSNYPYGEVGSASWTSMNGGKLGNCNYPGYTQIVFEPIDEYKGDLARSYFYVATRYYNEDNGWQSNGMVTGSQLKPWAVNMLLEWHHQDLVSQKEIDRNNAVFNIQNNRNPYIDQPDFADKIWGNGAGFPHEIAVVYQLYPNPCRNFLKIVLYDGQRHSHVFVLSDISGRKIFSSSLYSEKENLIDISHLKAGIYIGQIDEYPPIRIIKQ